MMIHFIKQLSRISVLFLFLFLTACGGGGGGAGSPVADTTDSDGDGLTDVDEINKFGTSPVLSDTDGDGFDDFKEVVTLGFDPTNNNFKFNPRIADVPKIKIELTSVPDISLNLTSSTGTETSVTTGRSDTVSTTTEQSSTETNSTSIENSHTEGAKAGFEGLKLKAEVSYEQTTTTTQESSRSWTTTESQTNSSTVSNAQTEASNNNLTVSSGSMSYAVKIINDGEIAFTLNNLILSSLYIDTSHPDGFVPIGNLNLDTQFSRFPNTTFGPGSASEPLKFFTNLNVGTTEDLLLNSSGLVTKVAVYEVLDATGRSYTHDETAIGAKTAMFLIDYGKTREKYLVATNGDPNQLGVSAKEVMEKILRVPYTTDAGTGILTSVRDSGSNPAKNASWIVVHVTDNGIEKTITTFDNSEAYDFDTLVLKAGGTLHLVYEIDEDGDGLGFRREQFLGTNPELADTDGDGLNDKAEIDGWDVSVISTAEMRGNQIGFGKSAGWPNDPNRNAFDGRRAFNGDLDEIRIWTVARTEAEITGNAHKALIAPTTLTGLLGYWPLDTIVKNTTQEDITPDLSGRGNDAVILDADLTKIRILSTTDSPTVGGAAFSFFGGQERLVLPEGLVSGNNRRPFTFEARFRISSERIRKGGLIFGYQNAIMRRYVPMVYVDASGELRAQLWVGRVAQMVLTKIGGLSDGNWYHVALVYDGVGKQTLYLKGPGVDINATLPGAVSDVETAFTIHVSSDPTASTGRDVDRDGLEDLAEKNQGTNPNNSDTDTDGAGDLCDPEPLNPAIRVCP